MARIFFYLCITLQQITPLLGHLIKLLLFGLNTLYTSSTITQSSILSVCWLPLHCCPIFVETAQPNVKNQPHKKWSIRDRTQWKLWSIHHKMEHFSTRTNFLSLCLPKKEHGTFLFGQKTIYMKLSTIKSWEYFTSDVFGDEVEAAAVEGATRSKRFNHWKIKSSYSHV